MATKKTRGAGQKIAGMRVTTMQVEYLRKRKARYNPREITADDAAALRRSLQGFGIVQVVVFNERTKTVVGGHQTIDAAHEEGWPSLPVALVDLDRIREKALNVALNKISGDFDADKLRTVLEELQEASLETLELSGFTLDEYEELQSAGGSDGGQVAEPTTPDPPKAPTSRRGDVWIMGRHVLVCGDATDSATLKKALLKPPSLIVTDPPYGVDYEGGRNVRTNQQKRKKLEGDTDAELYAMALKELLPLCTKSAVAYLWLADVHAETVLRAVRLSGMKLRALVVWNKLHAKYGAFMRHYMAKSELCAYAVRGAARWAGPTNEVTVWDVEHTQNNPLHPTQKPVELMARAIRNHRGDVCDPFLGSGTTLLAAEQLGRRCFAVELDPRYVDVAILRWQDLTGKEAHLADTQATFRCTQDAPPRPGGKRRARRARKK